MNYLKGNSRELCQGSVVQVGFSPLSAEDALVRLSPLCFTDLVAVKELLVLICADHELASLRVAGVDINHPPSQLAREGAYPVRIALNMGISMLVQMAFLLFALLCVMGFVPLNEITGEKQSRLTFEKLRVVGSAKGSRKPFTLKAGTSTNQQVRLPQRGNRRGGNIDMIWVF